MRVSTVFLGLLASSLVAHTAFADDALRNGNLPNGFPFLNKSGTAATVSTAGFVDLHNAFHLPQGTNGRTCESCHLPHAGWSVRPVDVELQFLLTGGTAPLFNVVDANSATAPVKTTLQRYTAYSMLRKGLFRRGANLPPDAEFTISAVDDPLRAGGSPTRFEFFRRPLATANFHIARNIGWHDQNTNGSGDIHAGLTSQAGGAIINAEQGSPATPEILESIATYEESLRFAQQSVFGVGLLTSCGGRGGPGNLSAQLPVAGPFNLYDAWGNLKPGSCTSRSEDRKRVQIARGQALFNGLNVNGRSCAGCHDAQNNGSNVNGTLFDIGTSEARFRKPGMPLYTLTNKVTGETRQTTDPGRAARTGRWAEIDRFKVPSLRGLAARPPYFHNGIAGTLQDVVTHYEVARGFRFTPSERDDLVAFLEAL